MQARSICSSVYWIKDYSIVAFKDTWLEFAHPSMSYCAKNQCGTNHQIEIMSKTAGTDILFVTSFIRVFKIRRITEWIESYSSNSYQNWRYGTNQHSSKDTCLFKIYCKNQSSKRKMSYVIFKFNIANLIVSKIFSVTSVTPTNSSYQLPP